jgi:hypothetical protein
MSRSVRRLRPWRARQWVAYAAVLVVATTALLLGAGKTPAHADLQRFQAVGAAEGMSDLVYSPNAPLADTLVDFRIPSAQATVDGLGTSIGFAGAPYPGDTVVSAPGLVASAICSNTGHCDGLPDFPLVTTSSYPAAPNPPPVDAGAFRLVAQSTAEKSVSEATSGGTAQNNSVGRLLAHAEATGVAPSDQVAADATSTADVINVAGLLRIGSVTATAHAEFTSDGKVKKSSTLEVDGVSVGGVAAKITPAGIQIAGQKVPVDPNSLSNSLKKAGVTVRLVQPVETDTGITSGAVVVTQQQTVNHEPATHTYTFGGSRAYVAAVKLPSLTTSVTTTTTTNVAPPASTTGTPGTPAVPGTTTPGTPSRTVPAPIIAAPAAALPAHGLAAFAHMWTTQFYLILVVAGLVIIGGARLTTTLAVRRTWTS